MNFFFSWIWRRANLEVLGSGLVAERVMSRGGEGSERNGLKKSKKAKW